MRLDAIPNVDNIRLPQARFAALDAKPCYPVHTRSNVNTSRTRNLSASATCCNRSAATPRYCVAS